TPASGWTISFIADESQQVRGQLVRAAPALPTRGSRAGIGELPPLQWPATRTRTPTFTSRGVPVVEGFVCTNDTWLNRFCAPKKTCTPRPTSRRTLKSNDA